MAARRGRRRGAGHGAGGHGHDGPDERWLLTYADMITLLMALFIVMWSMSTVDAGKLNVLSASLRDAFSGKILPGGPSVLERGASEGSEPAPPQAPIPAIVTPKEPEAGGRARRAREDDEFRRIKAALDSYAAAHGLRDKLQATIARRGLVVRLLTDNVLFDSGRADLHPSAHDLLRHISTAVERGAPGRPMLVEGHTDTVPVSGTYPSNWELSTARASSVVRFLIGAGTSPADVGAAGYADTRPAASNGLPAGRARNRRVEIVLLRQRGGQPQPKGTP